MKKKPKSQNGQKIFAAPPALNQILGPPLYLNYNIFRDNKILLNCVNLSNTCSPLKLCRQPLKYIKRKSRTWSRIMVSAPLSELARASTEIDLLFPVIITEYISHFSMYSRLTVVQQHLKNKRVNNLFSKNFTSQIYSMFKIGKRK